MIFLSKKWDQTMKFSSKKDTHDLAFFPGNILSLFCKSIGSYIRN